MDCIVEYPLHIRIPDIIPPILPRPTHQRKKHVAMTSVQLFLLEDMYEENGIYDMDIVKEAALYTGLEEETVEVWLKNRRCRPKRQHGDDINKSPMNKFRKYSSTLTSSNNQCKALDNPVKITSDIQSGLCSNISCSSTFTSLDYPNSTYSTTSTILDPFTTSFPRTSSSSTLMNSNGVCLGNATLPDSPCSSASSDFETQTGMTSPKDLDSSYLSARLLCSDKEQSKATALPHSTYPSTLINLETPIMTSSNALDYPRSLMNRDTICKETFKLVSSTCPSSSSNLKTRIMTSPEALDSSCVSTLINFDKHISTPTVPGSPYLQDWSNFEMPIVTSSKNSSYQGSSPSMTFDTTRMTTPALPSSTYSSTFSNFETQNATSPHSCSSVNSDTTITVILPDSPCSQTSSDLEKQIVSTPEALDSSCVSMLMNFDKQCISTPSLPGSTYSPNRSNAEMPIVTSSSPSINLDTMCMAPPSLCFTYSPATTNFETQTTMSSKALDPSCSSTVTNSDTVCLETVILPDSSCLTTTVFETLIEKSPETLDSSSLSTRPMTFDKEHTTPTLRSSTYPSALTNFETQIMMTSPKASDSSSVSTLVNFDKQCTTILPECSNFQTFLLISSSPSMNSETICMVTPGLPGSAYSSTFTNVETQTMASPLNALNHSYSSTLINSDTEVTAILPDSICSSASRYLETQDVAIPGSLDFSCLSTLNFNEQCTANPTLPRLAYPSTFTNLETQTKISQETLDHSYSLKLMNLGTTCELTSALSDSTCSSASTGFQNQTETSAKRLDSLCLSTLMKLDAGYAVTDVAEGSTCSLNSSGTKTQNLIIPKIFDSSSTLPNFGRYRKISQLPPNYSASQKSSKWKHQKRNAANSLDNEWILEDLFNQTMYPDKTAKFRVAMKIGLNMAAVNEWFNSRRRKYKRMSKGP